MNVPADYSDNTSTSTSTHLHMPDPLVSELCVSTRPPTWVDLIESASSPLVSFGGLNDNTIKGLTSLLSVEQEIEFISYTCGLCNEKCIKGSTRRQT
jgi:hypothetical protein